MQFRTRAIHVGNERDPSTGAVVPPIHLATTFVQPGAGEWGEFDYTRSGNPTRRGLERTLASLESGTHALAFATGMAAITTVLHLLPADAHVIAGNDIYGGTYRLFANVLPARGLRFSLVDMGDLAAIEAAIEPDTALIWIETPSNPLLDVCDIAAVAAAARAAGALVAVAGERRERALSRKFMLHNGRGIVGIGRSGGVWKKVG